METLIDPLAFGTPCLQVTEKDFAFPLYSLLRDKARNREFQAFLIPKFGGFYVTLVTWDNDVTRFEV